MKTILQAFLGTFFLSTIVTNSTIAQGLIVNEISNGGPGTREYVELVVVGSASKTSGTVDLSNWIIDDNALGALSPHATASGIATGHVRLSSSCFSAIPIGSIIVIHNGGEVHVNMPASDVTDANNDKVYIIPHTSTCLEYCASFPSSSVVGATYALPNCNNVGYVATPNWGYLGMSNAADGMQVRMPNGTLYHALGYGFSSAPATENIHAQLGTGISLSSFIGSGEYAFAYGCGVVNNPDNIDRINYADATPGNSNNAENQVFLDNIRNGSFDYTNWGAIDNCALPLPLHLTSFGVTAKEMQKNELNWILVTVDPYSYVEIQRSKDGFNFYTVDRLALEATMEERQYTYTDNTPYFTTYYRLKFTEPNAPISYSDVRVVTHIKINEQNVIVYPNPTRGDLNITLQDALLSTINYEVIDVLGRVVLIGEIPAQQNFIQLSTSSLEKGNYFVRLHNEEMNLTCRFIKS